MKLFSEMSLEELISQEGFDCGCGRRHKVGLKQVLVNDHAMDGLPESLAMIGVKKPFIISDVNTRAAAWHLVEPVLVRSGIPFHEFVFTQKHIEPDEQALGSLVMAVDPSCDGVVALGSGVLNDLAKVFAHALKVPSLVIATAPSMDGYASDNASMIRGRVKVSLYNACPQAIIADTRVLCAAPFRMLQAGFGDMLAKYLSICEWRLANLVIGEYYCENIAGLVRASVKRIVDSLEGLKRREETAVKNVTEGLILSGIAMAFAGVSRPASGLEHYFSHLWEMMSIDRGLPAELHGIQVGIGTLLSLKIWDQVRLIRPDRQKAELFMQSFDESAWENMVRRIFGAAADNVLAAARKEGRNNPGEHAKRLAVTVEKWQEILAIADEELPPYEEIEKMMAYLDMPLRPIDIGFSWQDTVDAFHGAREIRLKYLTSSLLWDLGLLYTLPFPEQPAS